MRPSDWLAITIFLLILLGWIFLSSDFGLGTIAIAGAAVFLIAGLVQWGDINSGVNWGVILLYASAISLGVQMKDTGAAQWVAENFLALMTPFGVEKGVGLWGGARMGSGGEPGPYLSYPVLSYSILPYPIGPYWALYRALYRALFRALQGCPI